MAYSYILFGLQETDLETTHKKIEQALSITFNPHTSDDGGDYWVTDVEESPKYTLRLNAYEDETGWQFLKPKFREHTMLFDIYGFKDRDNLKEDVLAIPDLNPVILREVVE